MPNRARIRVTTRLPQPPSEPTRIGALLDIFRGRREAERHFELIARRRMTGTKRERRLERGDCFPDRTTREKNLPQVVMGCSIFWFHLEDAAQRRLGARDSA